MVCTLPPLPTLTECEPHGTRNGSVPSPATLPSTKTRCPLALSGGRMIPSPPAVGAAASIAVSQMGALASTAS